MDKEMPRSCFTEEDFLIKLINNTKKPSFILEFDFDFSILQVNRSFQELFYGEKQPTHFLALLQQSEQAHILEKMGEMLESGTEFQIELPLLEENGTSAWYYMDICKYVSSNSQVKLIGSLLLITHQKEVEEKLAHVDAYFNALQELSEDLLFMVDIETKTLIRQSVKAKALGFEERTENFPYSVCESGIIHPDYMEKYMVFGNLALEGKEGNTEVLLRQRDGTFHHYQILWTPVVNKDGSVKEIFGKMLNIQSMRDLEEKANFDALTSTLNKQTIAELTSRFLQDSTDNDYHALFFLDLDDFKGVNDSLGHSFGDYLLKTLGTRFIQNTRSGDFIGRVGGDEFVIFLRDIPSVDLLIRKAKTILSAIHEEIVLGNQTQNIHASIGIAMYPDHGKTYEELYKCADLALYRSKGLGKNVATIYRPQDEGEKA